MSFEHSRASFSLQHFLLFTRRQFPLGMFSEPRIRLFEERAEYFWFSYHLRRLELFDVLCSLGESVLIYLVGQVLCAHQDVRRIVANDLTGVSARDKTGYLPSVGVCCGIVHSSLSSRRGEFTASALDVLADTFFQLCAHGFRLVAIRFVSVCKYFGRFSGERMNRHLQELPCARVELCFGGNVSSTYEHISLALAHNIVVCVKNIDELSVNFHASWITVVVNQLSDRGTYRVVRSRWACEHAEDAGGDNLPRARGAQRPDDDAPQTNVARETGCS